MRAASELGLIYNYMGNIRVLKGSQIFWFIVRSHISTVTIDIEAA